MSKTRVKFAISLAAGLLAALVASSETASAGPVLTYSFQYASAPQTIRNVTTQLSASGILTVTTESEADYAAFFGVPVADVGSIYAADDVYDITGITGMRDFSSQFKSGTPTITAQAITSLVTAAQDAAAGYQLGIDDFLYVNKTTGAVGLDDSGFGYLAGNTKVALFSDAGYFEYATGGQAQEQAVMARFREVPEPMPVAMLGLGLVGLTMVAKRRQAARKEI